MKNNYQNKIDTVISKIKNANKILIGAGSGLSTAAGITYSGNRFRENFENFIQKYSLIDMYSAGFYPFKTSEEKWAYWSRHIKLNRYDDYGTALYKELYDIVKEKEYFVITTNVDYLFYKTGFDENKIFAVQGDYGKFQCSIPCHNKLYNNKNLIMQMVNEQKDCKIPSELIPKCPICGKEMEINIRKDSAFVQDKNWIKASDNYLNFIGKYGKENIVLLELGVGYNTPNIIKYPFEKITYNFPNVTLVRINKDFSEANIDNKNKTITFNENIRQVLDSIKLQINN